MENKKIAKAFTISILSMLLPMIIATRIWSSSMLSVLYSIGFGVQVFSMMWALSSSDFRFRIKMNFRSYFLVYFIILLMPLIYVFIFDISLNYFDPLNSIIKLISFWIYYVMMQSVITGEESIYKFCKGIVVISVFVCIYSLIFEFRDIMSISNIVNTNTLKIRSVFSNRNQYSAFLIIAIIANLYLNQMKPYRLRGVTYLLQVFCVLTTFSRAAFFSIFIIFAMMFIQKRNLQKKIAVLTMISVIVVTILFTTGVFEYVLTNYVRLETSGDSGRFKLWKYAWDIARENSFFGIGFYTAVDIATSRGMKLTQFHNMFIDLLVDGGIFEVLFIIFILYSAYKKCVRNCPNQNLVCVYRASMVAFVFHACFESLSIFALSYSDTLYTIFYVSLPILLSNISKNRLSGENEIGQYNIPERGR